MKSTSFEKYFLLWRSMANTLATAEPVGMMAAEKQAVMDDLHRDLIGEAFARPEYMRQKPIKEKLADMQMLGRVLASPGNARVFRVFLTVALAMAVLPIIALFIGMKVLSPLVGGDDGVVGGLLAVGVTITIMAGYTMYALNDEDFDERKQQASVNAKKAAEEKKGK